MRLVKLFALLATLTAAVAATAQVAQGGWGPETPYFNLEAILRPTAIGPEEGFGLVKFRQPNDDAKTIYLEVWVRDLDPDRTYFVQRAVDDTPVDDNCAGTNWEMPRLGQITTDENGTGRASLTRPLPASVPPGKEFDIHFRIAETPTAASGVLQSGCYQFTVSL
jgi:hypothetical protein